MSDPELVESANRLEIRSPMRAGMRVVFAALALFPLIAPYELIIRIEWEYYLHPFFFLAAFISAGAVAISGFFVFAAFAGLSSRMVFDGMTGTFTYTEEAPVIRRSTRVHALADIHSVEVGVRDWSDSAPTYHVRISMSDGTVYESGASWTREEVESIRSRVDAFLTRARVTELGGRESGVSSTIREMWEAFKASGAPGAESAETYTSWCFGTGSPMVDELVELVLAGPKRATAGALWSYEFEGEPVPEPGDYSVITDGSGTARCVIRTIAVETVPFSEVDAEHAAAEGEGDLSLAYWREAHWRFFTMELAEFGRTPEPDMPVVCERFEVVFPLELAGSGERGPDDTSR